MRGPLPPALPGRAVIPTVDATVVRRAADRNAGDRLGQALFPHHLRERGAVLAREIGDELRVVPDDHLADVALRSTWVPGRVCVNAHSLKFPKKGSQGVLQFLPGVWARARISLTGLDYPNEAVLDGVRAGSAEPRAEDDREVGQQGVSRSSARRKSVPFVHDLPRKSADLISERFHRRV